MCRLTRVQRAAYLDLLHSDEVRAVLSGELAAFRALTLLRKARVRDRGSALRPMFAAPMCSRDAIAMCPSRVATASREHTGC